MEEAGRTRLVAGAAVAVGAAFGERAEGMRRRGANQVLANWTAGTVHYLSQRRAAFLFRFVLFSALSCEFEVFLVHLLHKLVVSRWIISFGAGTLKNNQLFESTICTKITK